MTWKLTVEILEMRFAAEIQDCALEALLRRSWGARGGMMELT